MDVECVPEDIVGQIDVDVSGLDLNHSFHVKDLKVDAKKYEVLTHGDEVIAFVSAVSE